MNAFGSKVRNRRLNGANAKIRKLERAEGDMLLITRKDTPEQILAVLEAEVPAKAARIGECRQDFGLGELHSTLRAAARVRAHEMVVFRQLSRSGRVSQTAAVGHL